MARTLGFEACSHVVIYFIKLNNNNGNNNNDMV